MPEPVSITLEATLPPSLNRPRTISPPGAFVRVQERPDGTLVFVAPRPTHPLVQIIGRQFRALAKAVGQSLFPAMVRMAAEMEATAARVNAVLRAPVDRLLAEANALPRIAGLEARYHVRAGLDPAYATPEALTELVQTILSADTDYDPDLALVTGENLRAIAVAAMRGWALGRPLPWRHPEVEPDPPYVAHRLWGTARVAVSCG